MNYLLLLNKKYFLFFIIFYLLIFLSIFFRKNYLIVLNSNDELVITNSKYDIENPNFIMNNNKNKIVITADEGNFISQNEILLRNNVIFESDKFKILSKNVLFNKKEQTAISETNSKFRSNKTEIISEGFSIMNEGEKIVFNGKTTVTLEK